MRVSITHQLGRVSGYTLHLTADETEAWASRLGASWASRLGASWASRLGASWPCSAISGHALSVWIDRNGLADVDTSATNVNHDELAAIVADHQPDECRHLWPAWHVPSAV